MTSYIVYRIGSNAANQPGTIREAIGTLEAENLCAASLAAMDKYGNQCYNNQTTSVTPRAHCKLEDRQDADEADEARRVDREYWESLRVVPPSHDKHPRAAGPDYQGEGGPVALVLCPDCGQMEWWTAVEIADHGKCRATSTPCPVCEA